jgi:hypothetical protein
MEPKNKCLYPLLPQEKPIGLQARKAMPEKSASL